MAIVKPRRPHKPTDVADSGSEPLRFAAEIPVGEAQPLWKVQLHVDSQPQADGERVRIRAHLQTNLASALRPALAASRNAATSAGPKHAALSDFSDSESGTKSGTGLRLAERSGQLAQRLARRALQVPLLRRLAEPLLQLDFNTWIEVQASTASLDAGSRELLPQAERLAALGIHPRAAGADAPHAETWAGEAPDGVAQVSVLQMDRRHLPARLLKLLGDRPFGLAATIVNTVQKKK